MKRRAWRITIGAAVLVGVLVAILAVAYWGTVRDHVEAWHFQLTRETETIEPLAGEGLSYYWTLDEYVLHRAADQLHCPVIFDPQGMSPQRPRSVSGGVSEIFVEKRGFRVLEQRFPRRAFLVIGASGAERP